MPAATMTFESDEAIGRVMSVDTMRVFVHVDDHELLKQVMVGNLLAIQGATGHQYLVSIVERITRLPTNVVEVLEGKEEEETQPEQENVQDTIRAILVGTYRTKDGASGPSFKRGADSCPQIDQPCYLIGGSNLSSFMNVLSLDIPAETALLLGSFAIDTSAQAFADGDRFFQRHAAILGSTGSGKSYTVASLLERANNLSHPNIILFDLHGEYASLAKEKENGFAEYFKIAGPGDLVTPTNQTLFLPFWLLNREEMLSMFLDRSDDNAPNQAMRFTSLVLDKKREELTRLNLKDVLASFTVDSPVPYDLASLISILEDDDQAMVTGSSGRDKQGPWHGKLTRFISRLEAKIADRRYGFLFQPPATHGYSWFPEMAIKFLSTKSSSQSGIKIVDFSEVPSDVLPTVVSVLARALYDIQFWMKAEHRTPVCLVCDEAHLYLPVRADADAVSKRALDTFERIAKEGRKYGFALLVVSQRPSDVSKTILSQCNNFIALRLTNEQDQSAVKSVMPDSMAGIADILPLLDIGEAIVLGDAILLPSRIKLTMPKARPLSLTRNFWQEWSTRESSSIAIKEAVENLRKQSRN